MMNTRQATAKAIQMFHAANPTLTDVQIVWNRPMTRVTFPTGVTALLGEFTATAKGYRSHRFIVNADADGIMLR